MTTTKKLTPVKRAAPKSTPAKTEEVQDSASLSLILAELKRHTEYMHSMDWKLWMLMNMIRIIGEENGYTFKLYQGPDDQDSISGIKAKESE